MKNRKMTKRQEHAVEQPLQSSNGTTVMSPRAWMRPPDKKWDDAYVPYGEPSSPRLVSGRWQRVPTAAQQSLD